MARVILAALLGRRLDDLLAVSTVRFTVLPNDLDLNLHMNNGRYLTLMDLGRTDLVIRSGLLRPMLKRRWMPVIGGAMVRYRRSLGPFERFVLCTKLLCWDEKWLFIEHRIERPDGTLACHALVKGLFLAPGGAGVPPSELLALLGQKVVSPPMPAGVAAWLESERDLRGESVAARELSAL
jgi:acyl-CoA thioesterase FadM